MTEAASRSRPGWAAALPPLLIAIVYGRTLGFEFVWDDKLFSTLPVYASFDLSRILISPANGIEYLPIRDLTLLFDHALFGAWAGGFHLTNVVLFAGASLLALAFYGVIFEAAPNAEISRASAWLALACTLIWVAHPLQVEPVAFVTGRNALLALCFVLASLLVYARHLRSGSHTLYGASILFAVSAFFSKATALCLPILLLLCHVYIARPTTVFRAARRLIPHFAVAGAAAAVHFWMAQGSQVVNQPLTLQGFLQRAPKIVFVPEFYLFKFLWPTRLTIEYSLQGFREHLLVLGLASAALGLIFLTIVVRGHRDRSLGWLLTWGYVVSLIPVMNLLPTHPAVADRYAQLALVWLAPLLLVPIFRTLPRAAVVALVVALVATLSVLSFRQVGTWRDEPTLFAHATTVNPHAIHSLGNLGTVLWERGREEEALEAFARLARLRPLDFRRDYYRGVRAMREGDLRTAELWLTAASKKRGLDLYRAHMRLGELYMESARYSEARASLERAIGLMDRAPSPGDDRERIERSLLLLRSR
jgi:hypothetical protein